MDLHKAIRIRAYRAVTGPLTRDYMYRRIMRWYSKTFATPLSAVEELPVEDVLQIYWEETYEEMDESQRAEELATLLQTEEELREAQEEEDEFDVETWIIAKQEAAKERKKQAKKAKAKAEQSSGKIAEIKEPQKLITPVAPPVPLWDKAPPSMSMSFDLDVDDDLVSEDFGPMTGIKKR